MNSYIQLLNEYKQYDSLNKNRERPLVKILVSYIKPAFLFKSEILTPIHLGRAVERESSKDGTISDEDIKWLHENCISDDDFEGNISAVNRRVGFLTGTYWAWKNYDKLGNPEYFGSFGIRKLFNPNFLNTIQNYDIILPLKRSDLKYETNKIQFIKYHSEKLYKAMKNNFKACYPEESSLLGKYLNLNYGYYHELYIMRKPLFFKFCEWIFPLLNILLKDKNCIAECKYENKITDLFYTHGLSDIRDIAYIIEILTGYYLYKTVQDKRYKYCEWKYEMIQASQQYNNNKLFELLRKRAYLQKQKL